MAGSAISDPLHIAHILGSLCEFGESWSMRPRIWKIKTGSKLGSLTLGVNLIPPKLDRFPGVPYVPGVPYEASC